MPTFSFEGFPAGDPVALSALQLGETSTNSVASWGVFAGGSMVLDVETAAVVTAPAQVWSSISGLSGFNADETSLSNHDPSFHELRWLIRVQKSDGLGAWIDDPLPDWAAPENMLAEWNNPNRRFTKRATFVLPEKGTYRIVTQAVDSEGVHSPEIYSDPIIVEDPDDAYQSSRTIVYSDSPTEDWSAAPAGAIQVTSITALQAALDTSGPRRILFKRGSDITLPLGGITSNGYYMTYIGAWGSGERPILRPDPNAQPSDLLLRHSGDLDVQFTIADLDLRCPYDPSTEQGLDTGAFDFRFLPNDSVVTVHNVRADGFSGVAFATSGNADATRGFSIAVNDCELVNFSNYGTYSNGNANGSLAFLGTKIAQSPDALQGSPKTIFGNRHGPLRIPYCTDIEITGCDIFSNSGWSGGIQSCLRLFTNGGTNGLAPTVTVNRCVMEGGATMITTGGLGASTSGNWLIDGNLLIGNAGVKSGISIYFSGATIRNNVMWYPDVAAPPSSQDFRAFLVVESYNPSADHALAGVDVYNNSVYSELSAANDAPAAIAFITDNDGTLTVTEDNNILYAPDGTTPFVDEAPIDVTRALADVTPRYIGYRYNFEVTDLDRSTTIPDGGTIVINYADIMRQDENGQGPAIPVDQAFVDALIGTKHQLGNGENIFYFADKGDFTVTTGSTSLTITNTSGTAWDPTSGTQNRSFRLDMTEHLDNDLPLQLVYDSPDTVFVPRPQIGSSQQVASTTKLAQTDFFGDTRGGFFDLDTLEVTSGDPIGGAIDELG